MITIIILKHDTETTDYDLDDVFNYLDQAGVHVLDEIDVTPITETD